MKRIILKTLIITFVISAILGISIIFLDLWNEITGKILASTLIIFGFSIPGLSCSTYYDKRKEKTFSLIGMTTCFIGAIYLLLLAWGFLDYDILNDLSWRFVLSSILLSLSFGHMCLVLTIESNVKSVNYLKKGTLILSSLMDILLLLIIFIEVELSWKLLSAIAILIVLGTIVTPLLNKLNNKSNDVESDLKEDKYTRLEQLKSLLDNNAITKDEYEIEKHKLLNHEE